MTSTATPLTIDRLNAFLSRAQQYADWCALVAFCRNWYGPEATTAFLSLSSEYNDEGGYELVLDDISVYDAHGSALDTLRLPEWTPSFLDRKYASMVQRIHDYNARPNCQGRLKVPSRETWERDYCQEQYREALPTLQALNAEEISLLTPPVEPLDLSAWTLVNTRTGETYPARPVPVVTSEEASAL